MKRFPWIPLAAFGVAASAAALLGLEWARLEVEKGLGRFLKVPVRLERLSFSPRHLTLHNVSLKSPSWVPLRIERLQMEGWNVWRRGSVQSVTLTGLTLSVAGVPMQMEGRVFLTGRPGSYAEAEGWLALEHPFLRGRVEVSGRLLRPVLFGWLEGARVGRRHFVSQWEVRQHGIRLSSLQLQGGWTADGALLFHPAPSAVAGASGSATTRPGSEVPWRGELRLTGPASRFWLNVLPSELGSEFGSTHAALWAYREGLAPAEFTGEWAVRGSRLHFQAALMDKQAIVSGQMSLRFPYRTDVVADLDGLRLSDVVDWLPGDPPSRIAGRIAGRVRLSFVLPRMLSRGELSAEEGRFGQLEFKEMKVRFQGEGAVLRLEDSRMTSGTGTVLMDGLVDLRRLGHRDFFRLVKLSAVKSSPAAKGWEVTPTAQSSGMQVQVSLSPEQRVSLRVEGQEEFLGVEHRKKF